MSMLVSLAPVYLTEVVVQATSYIPFHHAIAFQGVAENVNAGKAADMTHVRITCSPSVKTSSTLSSV